MTDLFVQDLTVQYQYVLSAKQFLAFFIAIVLSLGITNLILWRIYKMSTQVLPVLTKVTAAVNDLTTATGVVANAITVETKVLNDLLAAYKAAVASGDQAAILAAADALAASIEGSVANLNQGAVNLSAAAAAAQAALPPPPPPAATSISATPSSISGNVGDPETQLKIVDNLGNDVTSTSSFASVDNTVASVDPGGKVALVGSGSTAINVTNGSLSASVSVSVVNSAPAPTQS